MQETDLKNLAQTTDVPKGLQYCIEVVYTLHSANPQWIIMQLLDHI